MKTINKTLLCTAIIFALLLSACGVLQEPEAPSAPIEAVPLEVETEAPAESAEEAGTAQAGDENVDGEADVSDEEVSEEPAQETVEDAVGEAAEDSAEAIAEGETAVEPAAEVVVYEITPEGSRVRFELDEDLRGNRITVVGETDQVAGQIAINFSDLSTTQVGVIQINARTLVTDNNFRNRALQNEILDTGSFEFVTFTPTSVNGLPNSVEVGESVQFSITGDLTIRDITNEVVFDVEATVVSESTINGTASTVVNREAYGLQIPSVPNVANVEEAVELYIDFSANAS